MTRPNKKIAPRLKGAIPLLINGATNKPLFKNHLVNFSRVNTRTQVRYRL